MSARERKICETEKSASAQLPDNIFGWNSRAVDWARSFGLFPMLGGWIAGGVIGKLAMTRVKGSSIKHDQKAFSSPSPFSLSSIEAEAKVMNEVDPSASASQLLDLRMELIRRGKI